MSMSVLPRAFWSWLAIAIAAISYYLLMLGNYAYVISPRYAYMSFLYYDNGWVPHLYDLFFLIIPIPFMSRQATRVSDVGIVFMYVIMYVPCILLLTCLDRDPDVDAYLFKSSVLASFVLLCLFSHIFDNLHIKVVTLRPSSFWIGFGLISAAALLLVVSEHGLSLKMPSYETLYDQRDEFKQSAGSRGITIYSVGFLQKVVAAFLGAYGLCYRKMIPFCASVAISFYIFSITGSKSSFVAVMFTFLTWLSIKLFYRQYLLACVLLCSSLLGVCWAFGEYSAFAFVNELFVRRIQMMQGMLLYYYKEAFVNIEPFYLRHSILSFLGPPPVSDVEGYVGDIYLGGGVHANANLWADGYVNYKDVGMMIESSLCGVFLSLLNVLTRTYPLIFAATALSLVFQMMTQTGFVKLLGTHGGVAICTIFILAGHLSYRREVQ